MEIEQKIKNIIADTFKIKVDSIKENTNANNTIGWDSLGHLKLILSLEREFGITIEPKHFIKMSDYKGIVNIVKLYTKGQ